jgi:methylmalonyl-CoA mutase N-terminal domain/subunit
MDEALALPSEDAARVALRTQQIIAHESGVPNTIDPLGGSYYVEALTGEMERQANAYFDRIDKLGGVIPAIEKGFFQREIADSAARYQREYVSEEPVRIPLLKMDPNGYARQVERLNRVRRERDDAQVQATLATLSQAAHGASNLMPPILDCVRAYATLGEVCAVLRQCFGEYREAAVW